MTCSVSRPRVGVVASVLLGALAALFAWTTRWSDGARSNRARADARASAALDALPPGPVAERPTEAALPDTTEVLTIRFSHVTAPETIKHRCAVLFKRRLEQLSAGRIRVEISPHGRAFHDGEELSALQAGLSDVLAVSLPQLGRLTGNDFELFGLPYLFEGEAEFRKVVDGPIGARLFRQLEQSGATGLAYWSNGFQGVGANRPLRQPSDIVGLRVRVQRSLTLKESFRVLGAKPFVTTFADQTLALESGEADAAENSLANFVTQKLDRFQPFFSTLRHVVLAYGVIVGKVWWEKLNAEERSLIDAALREATRESQRLATSSDREARIALAKRGKTSVVDLSAEQREAWKRALAPSYGRATPSVQALAHEVLRDVAPSH